MSSLLEQYAKKVEEEVSKTKEEIIIKNTGKLDPKKHLSSVLCFCRLR